MAELSSTATGTYKAWEQVKSLESEVDTLRQSLALRETDDSRLETVRTTLLDHAKSAPKMPSGGFDANAAYAWVSGAHTLLNRLTPRLATNLGGRNNSHDFAAAVATVKAIAANLKQADLEP